MPHRSGIVGMDKIIIDLSSHKTTDNIMEQESIYSQHGNKDPYVSHCDYVGIVSANKEPDKMKKAGFTTTKVNL